MEKLLIEAGKSFPTVIVTVSILFFIIYVLREYRKIRQDNEEQIKNLVNAKLGDFTASVQAEVTRLEAIGTKIEPKVEQIEKLYLEFMEDIDRKTAEIDKLYSEANEKLISLKQAIPNVDEYSTRDILALARSENNSQQQAEFCKRILDHEDATSEDLELAGDLMKESNRFALALSLYEKAHQLDPERLTAEAEYLSLKARLNPTERNESLRKAKEKVLSAPESNSFAAVANALLNLNRYEELAEFSSTCAKAVEGKNPKLLALAIRNLAVSYRHSGDLEGSVEAFNKALSIRPDDENTLKAYLGVFEDQGKNDEFLNIVYKLIEIDPTDVYYYRLCIGALIKIKKFDDALMWIERAFLLPLSPMDEHYLNTYKMKADMAANNMTWSIVL